MKPFKISVLDLAPVKQGQTINDTFKASLNLAQFVENLGYERYWLAEHHNMPNIASSATAVSIGYIANGTQTIRVGSGGVMLPNHSSLMVAEQFGTLESLFPNRIDLGVGRAPGTDGLTAQALGRNPATINEKFPRQILEVQRYFSNTNNDTMVRAFPGEGCNIPIYILGSSTDSAFLAAELGLPYAFAGHFAPDQMERAFQIYRQHFQPSDYLSEPYIIACVNAIAAETNAQAEKVSTTLYQGFLNLIRDNRQPYAPPVENMDELWNPMERAHVLRMLRYTFVGDKETIKEELSNFQTVFQANEYMFSTMVYHHEDRLKSYEIMKEVQNELCIK